MIRSSTCIPHFWPRVGTFRHPRPTSMHIPNGLKDRTITQYWNAMPVPRVPLNCTQFSLCTLCHQDSSTSTTTATTCSACRAFDVVVETLDDVSRGCLFEVLRFHAVYVVLDACLNPRCQRISMSHPKSPLTMLASKVRFF